MIELSILTDESVVEALSDTLLEELGALSVSVEDLDAGTSAEQALFGEPGMPAPRPGWQRSVLKALFPSEVEATQAATLMLAEHGDGSIRILAQSEVEDQDWVRLTQSQFSPVEITPEFWIVPTWHDKPAQATRTITLDPGLAFGTGTHPTTRMCLRWTAGQSLETRQQWRRVLDYGCGSGILAIGAALFMPEGQAHVIDAVDIDPAAVESTIANAEANGVALNAALPDAANSQYQLVLANILATPLKLLAPLLCGHVAVGGHLVLAGILSRQAEELTVAYAPWCDLKVTDEEDGWILMTAKF
jgi:ribosomal protein L11 methyltransferase